jgi:L-threonylcarbamoyladenylate synthase
VSGELRRAAETLRAGGLVAFPTETVYGLGADASSEAALNKLYALKRRPADHPVIAHFASAEDAFAWAREVPEAARRLAARFWPGPLTLILKRASHVGDFVTGGQDTIGLRVPSHPVAQALLREFGGAIAAPSANVFGRVSATSARHVKADFPAGVDFILEGAAGEVGIESTIVDLSRGRAVLLRPGRIAAAQLEQVLGAPVAGADAAAPRVSGTLDRHYAPKTPLKLVPPHAIDAEIAAGGGNSAVLAYSRPDTRAARWLRMPRDPEGYARRLYAALRELDAAGCEQILVEQPPEEPAWAAVRDRLRRAASAA